MKITERTESDISIIKPEGRIDWNTMPVFTDCLNRLIQEGSKKLLIDFSETEYIASSGMRTLITSLKMIEEKGGAMAICSLSDQLEELFNVVQFDKIIKIYKTDFEAFEDLL